MNAPFFPECEDLEVPVAPEGWSVDSEERAAWAVDRILSLEEAIERLNAQYERNATRLHRELERARSFFVPQLQAWAQAHPPKRGRTIHLSTGDLSFRKVPGGVFVQDEEACTEWCETVLPEAIRREVKRKLDVERVKRAAQQLMSAAVIKAGDGKAAPTNQAELQAMVADTVGAMRASLPPGCILRDDVDVFEVKGGK